jgi:hypothetical protein
MMKLPQGKKSKVTVDTAGGKAVVRKAYNSNGDPSTKCQREVAFYRWYEGVAGVPRLHAAECPTHILIELLDGTPLSVWHADKSESEIAALSLDHGRNMASFLHHSPADALSVSIKKNFPDMTDFRSVVDSTLSTVETYVNGNPGFDRPEIRQIVRLSRSVVETTAFWGQEILCKLDWNSGNVIVKDGSIAGYVDFEQSFFGNRIAFVGTLIDHINVLSWPQVRRGIESCGHVMPPANLQYAAACFSMCYKIRGCCRDGKITYFTPERLLVKFQEMRAMIEKAEQNACTVRR